MHRSDSLEVFENAEKVYTVRHVYVTFRICLTEAAGLVVVRRAETRTGTDAPRRTKIEDLETLSALIRSNPVSFRVENPV